MKQIERWRWWVHHDGTGRLHKTRHHMTEADALATDPAATRVDGTRQVLQVPASVDEYQYTQPGRTWRSTSEQ